MNAKRVSWKWFNQHVFSKSKWNPSFKPGSICSELKSHPALKFEFYHVHDGPVDMQGTWAVARRVLLLERHMPDAGGKVLIYHEPPKRAKKEP